jgi:lipopolysaccharide/colanic/teichoic acid biosynthesis glycosyltransferase
MNLRLPTSIAFSRLRFSPFDVIWAASSPLLALYLRNALVLADDSVLPAVTFCLISFIASLTAFATFRVHIGIPRYFSFHDAVDLAKAVAFGELLTCVALFTLTRLDGIPRSTPIIHALLLWAGLVYARGVIIITKKGHIFAASNRSTMRENVILIGLNDLAVCFTSCLQAAAGRTKRVIGLLDADPSRIGRAVNGIGVLGQPVHLDAIVEEFATHGVQTHRVVVAGAPEMLSELHKHEVHRVCAERGLELIYLNDSFGLHLAATEAQVAPGALATDLAPGLEPSLYFRAKRLVDILGALIIILVTLPLLLSAVLLTWLFVGSPISFWQQRLGLDGRSFDLYKLRTLRPPFDQSGRKVPDADRRSFAGRFFRAIRLDEAPQLLNVLLGDMSLIGPRPLLPQDQPEDPVRRLSVRPGITGWAQVNGGVHLTPAEKDALDCWYIQNATPWLDLQILVLTAFRMIRGDRRNERALSQACHSAAMEGLSAFEKIEISPIDAGVRASTALQSD